MHTRIWCTYKPCKNTKRQIQEHRYRWRNSKVFYPIFHCNVSKIFTASLRIHSGNRNQVDYWWSSCRVCLLRAWDIRWIYYAGRAENNFVYVTFMQDNKSTVKIEFARVKPSTRVTGKLRVVVTLCDNALNVKQYTIDLSTRETLLPGT